MNPETIYVKTEKGREEIRSRAAGLSQALRILLIATDGEKPIAKLARLHPAGAGVIELIAELQAFGFVEPLTAGSARPAAVTRPTAAPSRASAFGAPETQKYVMSLR
ncbi:hypothetical protein D0B54_00215 [Solimonas sp. K1W22B-7]|uniref:hypothetical protein n=1 Tax=Solimonas sp. K1W22B-7 TaxID=2303331 RepID=UPI000E32DE0D|nr:hypothetical protein [Solimonas sp. K1W22B-7]AXQ27207.1 hypothetical protein D0B54_00215 [Solimonas sp. K1W22B-7]